MKNDLEKVDGFLVYRRKRRRSTSSSEAITKSKALDTRVLDHAPPIDRVTLLLLYDFSLSINIFNDSRVHSF